MFREQFPFWNLEYHRLEVASLLRRFGLWMGLVGLVVVGALALWAQVGVGTGGLAFLSLVVLGSHQIAREALARRLPNRSFLEDLRTGNLDQFRLLLYQPHALLFQRYFPAFAMRLLVHSLWLPLYGVWGASVGLSWLSALCWWILFSFGSSLALALLIAFLLIPSPDWHSWALTALFVVPFLSRSVEARSVLWVGGLGVLLVSLRFLRQTPTPLPEMENLVWLWLCMEALRYHRLADWLNNPTGLVRHLWLMPALGVLLFDLTWLEGDLAKQFSWSLQESWEYGVAYALATAGWLSLVTLTLERGREIIQQTLSYHLRVSLTQRLFVLGVVLASMPILGMQFRSVGFWAVFLWLMVWGALSSGLVRYLIQVNWVTNRQAVFTALVLGTIPATLFGFLPTTLAPLLVLSPWVAVLSQTEVWNSYGILPVPPMVAALAPMAHTLMVVGVLVLGRWQEVSRPSTLHWLPTVLTGMVMLYPLWERIAVFRNPLSRLLSTERVPNYAFWAGIAGLVVGFLTARGSGLIFYALPLLGAFLWLWGYSLTARRCTRLRDSGELTSIFLTNLSAPQIFWGLVYSSWFHQVRVLISFVWAGLVGYFVGYVFTSVGLWGVQNPVIQAVFIVTFSTIPAVLFLLLWSCVWLFASPMAVRDALLHPPQSRRSALTRGLVAVVSALLGFCIVIAPLLLIFVPLHSSQALRRLIKLQQRPGEG